MLASSMVPAVGALDISSKALRVVGSQTYKDSVQSYAGEVSGSPEQFNGEEIGIAVLDTGVDDDHPTFAGDVFAAGAEVQTPCQPNDGDCMTDTNPSGGDPEGDCINPDDTDGHGTHAASIAMGQGGPGIGPRGIAPGAKLIDVKIASSPGGASLTDIKRGIDWVVRYNQNKAPCPPNPPVSVIALGLGGNEPHTSKAYDTAMQSVRKATDHGILVVTPAGNCGPGRSSTSMDCLGEEGQRDTVTSPGASPEALTVAAVDDKGTVARHGDPVAGYSSRGPNPANHSNDQRWRKPDVVAPGTTIAAACAQTTPSNRPQAGEGMDCNRTGTDVAAAHVAGLAAILFHARASFPNDGEITPSAIKQLITGTATDIAAAGWDRATGYGYVDGYKAVVKAVNRAPQSEFSFSPSEPEEGSAVTFDASLSLDPDGDVIDTYIWEFGDGSDPVTTATATVDHVYPDPGSYTVTLTVVDEHGTPDKEPYRRSVHVVEPPPPDPGDPPKGRLSVTPFSPQVGEEVILSAEGTTDPDDHRIVEYHWDMDARRNSFEAERSTRSPETNWTFLEPGARDVAVRVFDERGLSDTVYLSISVRPAPPDPPVVAFSNPQEGDTVEPGPMLASWTVTNPTNNFTLFLDGVEEAHLVRRQIRLDVPEGEHTLRIQAKGPGGEGQAWVNFTAAPQEGNQSDEEASGGDGGHDHDDHDHNRVQRVGVGGPGEKEPPDQAGTNQTPASSLAALVAGLLAALLVRRET